MIRKERFGAIINLFMNIIVGIILAFTALKLMNALSPMAFIQSFIMSLAVGYFVGDLLPAVEWGNKLADVVAGKNAFMRHLVSSVVLGFCLVIAISLICQFISFGTKMLPIWLLCIPYFLVFGTLAIFIFVPIITKLAIILTGFDPANPEV